MKKIAVIGSINMDLTCKTDRYPKPGETIFGYDLAYVPGGKGNNQAVAAARLGGNVTMFACVGDDAFGHRLIDNLNQNGVDTRFIQILPDAPTGIAIITVAEQDNTIVVVSGANMRVTKEYLQSVKEEILQSDILLMPNEIPMDAIAYVAQLGQEYGKTVVFNPAPVSRDVMKIVPYVTYLTPNEHETDLLFPGQQLEELLQNHNGKLIVTLGSQGAAAWDGKLLQIPARKANVVDTTGAGDTFNGALCYALSREYSLEKALRFANAAASLSTEGFGAQGGMPSLKAVLNAMENR